MIEITEEVEREFLEKLREFETKAGKKLTQSDFLGFMMKVWDEMPY